MDNRTIGLLLLAGGAALVFGLFSGSNEPRYRLANGQIVKESQLPGLGYVKYQGRWFSASALNNYFNTNNSAGQWSQLIAAGNQIFQAGKSLWQLIDELINQIKFGTNTTTINPGDILDPNDPDFGGYV